MKLIHSRWKALGQPSQECQKIFPAKAPMDPALVTQKLIGLGAKLLTDVDPNPDNYVCAGIIHTQTQQIGTLIRLEPNKQAKVRDSLYNISIRVSLDFIHFCCLLSKFSSASFMCLASKRCKN